MTKSNSTTVYIVRFKLGRWINVMESPVPNPDWPWAGVQLN